MNSEHIEPKKDNEEAGSTSGVSRREFLKYAGMAGAGVVMAGGLGGLLAACGGEDETTTTTAAATTTTAAAGSTTTAAGGGTGLVVKAFTKTTKEPKDLVFRFLNQVDGVPFYSRVNEGMLAAGQKLGIGDIQQTGPAQVDGALQVATVETWITQKVDVMVLSSTDPGAMAASIDKATEAGVAVLSWDVDAPDSSRLVFCDCWDPAKGPQALWDVFMELLGGVTKGQYAFITTALTSPTHNRHLEEMMKYQKEKYPEMEWVGTEVATTDPALASQKAKDYVLKYPDLVGMISVDAGGTVGLAQGQRELGLGDKFVTTGLSTPSQMAEYVKDGTVPKFVLWDPYETGYLTTMMAFELINGRDIVDGQEFEVSPGVMRKIPIQEILNHPGSLEAIQGPALIFDANNIDNYNF